MNFSTVVPRAAAMAVAVLLLTPPTASAQEAEPAAPVEENAQEGAAAAQAARQAVLGALALGQQGHFSDAVEQLDRARAVCLLATDAPECGRLVMYSLGYVHQVEANRAVDDRPVLLERAARYYQEVVDGEAGYQDAVYNLSLVLRELGPQEWQEPYYRAAPALDPGRRTQHLVFLGDYHAARAQWGEAIEAYEAALNEDVANRAAAAALVRVAAEGPVGQGRGLLEHAAAWERTLPDVAAEAYRAALRRLAPAQGPAAERAFLRLAVLTDGRMRTDGSAPHLAPPLAAAAAELEEFLYGTWRPFASDNWWLQAEDRRRALAEAALRAGTRWVAEGQPERAQQCWSAANAYSDPTWREALDLKRELALLYFRHEELDPSGERFRGLEQEIFLEKAAVLRAADHAAAQRYHTALGLIYAERNEWSVPRARNAIDQLTWALEQGAEVDAESGGHRPLPEIRMLLARGLGETGNTAGAQRLRLEAAMGYLDDDALQEAAAALEGAGEASQGGALRAVVATRRRLAALGPEAGADVEAVCGRRALDAATEAATAAGGEQFGARQRFKLLGDCARRLPAGRAAAYEAEAFELVAGRRLPLVGTADLRRFRQAQASVAEAAGLPRATRALRYDGAEGRASGIAIALPGESGPAYLPVRAEEETAARVVRLLSPGVERLRFRVDAGVVELDAAQARRFSPTVMAELASLEGVDAVRVGEVARGGVEH